MQSVTLKDQGPNQCAIFVGPARVGYVCYGEKMPINFLPEVVVSVKLTDEEKVTVAKTVREQMAQRTAERLSTANELAKLTGTDHKDEANDDSTNES